MSVPSSCALTFGWEQTNQIGAALAATFPEIDPATLKAPLIRKLIGRLPGFSGSLTPPDNVYYELVLDAWYEAFDAPEAALNANDNTLSGEVRDELC